MLKRIKSYLGVEGTRLELKLKEDFDLNKCIVQGSVSFESIRRERITHLDLWLEERYTLGRGEEKSIEKFELGRLSQATDLWVWADETLSVPFTLRFKERMSKADSFKQQQPLLKPLVALGKMIANAESSYTLFVEAKVEGTLLNPKASLKLR